ncbi:MAG: hypothetical protein ACTHMY_28635 [Solirubrobacteraceae bacterium]
MPIRPWRNVISGSSSSGGERDLTGLLPGPQLNSYAAAAQLHVPALFAVARDDRYVSVADMRAIYDHARSGVKHLVVLPAGSGHGWDLLQTIGGGWDSPRARASLVRHDPRAVDLSSREILTPPGKVSPPAAS